MQLLPRDPEVELVEELLAWHDLLQGRKLDHLNLSQLHEEEILTTEDQLLSWVGHVMAMVEEWATHPLDTVVVLAFPHSDTTQPSPWVSPSPRS